ncbi:MAG: hypothetical protein QG596_166 [Actinomycetota bacterium]|nr:hypothetical protein [Actinomycetota bacterium]
MSARGFVVSLFAAAALLLVPASAAQAAQTLSGPTGLQHFGETYLGDTAGKTVTRKIKVQVKKSAKKGKQLKVKVTASGKGFKAATGPTHGQGQIAGASSSRIERNCSGIGVACWLAVSIQT